MTDQNPLTNMDPNAAPTELSGEGSFVEEVSTELPSDAFALNPEIEIPIPYTMHSGEFDKDRVRMLAYADSGVGKTVFGSTWPKPVFFNIDDGLSSVKRRVGSIPIRTWDDLTQAFLFIANGKHPFQTVVVDSLNETQFLAMKNTVTTYTSVRRSYGNLPSMSDYGKALSDFDAFIRAMKALPYHVVFLAQIARRENETDIAKPLFTGKATADNVARMMDVVGYIYKGESDSGKKPRFIGFDESKFMTKDRSDKLPATVEITPDEGFERLYRYWAA